jgi:hypothetical protein
MAKNIWDTLSADARKAVIKKTGAFPGVVGKNWDELSEKVQARLLPGMKGSVTVAPAPEAKKVKVSPVVTVAKAKIDHSKKVLTKVATAAKVKSDLPDLDYDLINEAKKLMSKHDHDGLFTGHWPMDVPNFPGLYYVALPSSGHIVKANCVSVQEASRYIMALIGPKKES